MMRWAWLFAVLGAQAAEPGYVDPAACRPCHTQIFESYRKTGMGRSFTKAGAVPPLTEFFHAASERYYSVVERTDGHYMRRFQAGETNIIEKRIDYIIGSGNHSKTFLHRDQRGRLMELPVSWYSERGGHWAMSPGYDRADHSDFRREISDSCLFCHNGYPSEANAEANGGLAPGIDCQRCHGPGEVHLKGKARMVNPARLSSERQMEVCMQCHLESASRTLPDAIRRFGRGPFSYRPGEPLGDFMMYFDFIKPASDNRITVNNSAYGLMRSRCFLQSGGKLKCTTCHRPHGGEANYTQACRSCHQAAHDATVRDCAGCHMQKRRTEDAVHVVMTDHFIRPRPLPGDLLAPLQERHDRISGPVKLLYPVRAPGRAPDIALYLAMAKGSAPDLQKAIAATRPRDAEPYFALGEAYRKSGLAEEAIRAYRQAIDRAPGDSRSYSAISTLLLNRGDIDPAIAILEPAVERMPEDSSLLNSLAVLYARKQRFDDALRMLSKAVRLNSDEPLSWVNLGVSLEAKGDRKGAEAAYRQALLLQPDFMRAREYLSRVSKN
jgi:Flp pilus assembly protein TadD